MSKRRQRTISAISSGMLARKNLIKTDLIIEEIAIKINPYKNYLRQAWNIGFKNFVETKKKEFDTIKIKLPVRTKNEKNIDKRKRQTA